ncbi:uncharacterized protein LOC130804790 [Amaranthus tricolor]|uniref:uncharacterized protein LOC130804790 n=1 Tax=Amaranthus tricolor TaxID=29722 RepID=UPI0025901BC5|nr:uncharacterized protein LOC130804790 [Amaranthus tricolor]
MSPKPATNPFTISLFVALSFFFYVTSSTVTNPNCSEFNSVSDLLQEYDLPTGLFPDYVKSFSCERNKSDNSYNLSIQLHGNCKVTRTMFFVKNIVECQPQISAIVSKHKLTEVKGVTVSLYVNNAQVGELMTITDVQVVGKNDVKFLRFVSEKGPSPWFPYVDIVKEPPKCDPSFYIRPLLLAT